MMLRVPLLALLLACSVPAAAETKCRLRFDLSGWSLFYKTASGDGVITCDNGQSAKVRLSTKGGGITVGRSTIKNGVGTFTEVEDISELFGTYAQAEAHAGATKSAKASAMTKGEVSLSLAGKGKGVDLGVALGKFTIKPAE